MPHGSPRCSGPLGRYFPGRERARLRPPPLPRHCRLSRCPRHRAAHGRRLLLVEGLSGCNGSGGSCCCRHRCCHARRVFQLLFPPCRPRVRSPPCSKSVCSLSTSTTDMLCHVGSSLRVWHAKQHARSPQPCRVMRSAVGGCFCVRHPPHQVHLLEEVRLEGLNPSACTA